MIPLAWSLDTVGPIAPDVTAAAKAYTQMSNEAVSLGQVDRPRLAVPRGWVAGLDAPTAAAWRLVSSGLPEIDFVNRDPLFRVGLTILLAQAATYHRRWVEQFPEKYGSDVLAHLRRGLAILAVDLVEAMRDQPRLIAAAGDAMEGVDALLLPATAIVAPLVGAGDEVREPLARFTRPFNTTGQPVVALPAPGPRGALPVGMQVVGRTNAGALRAALWLEREWKNLTP